MPSFSRTAVAATALIASASAAFEPTLKTNVVTYWGQGANQERLIETCKNVFIDVINIGFVDVFPDQGPGGYPGTNFGNACWGDVYENDGVNTTLQKTCPYIGEDITACQETYGKKVFLSIGGGSPNTYYIDDDASGESFADFLWGAFGPSSANDGQPRPFGDAAVDGFDFDIESEISPAPTDSEGDTIAYATSGYAAMINHFHDDLFPTDASKAYYISGAPQCTLPDSHYTTVMANAWFDFMWIQFYNTPQCSARAGINYINGEGTDDISFTAWESSASLNPSVKYFIGLPAAEAAANDASYYLTLAEVQQLVKRFIDDASFGGLMLWEATYDMNNTICGADYATWVKQIVTAATSGAVVDTDPSTCNVATTTSSAVSTPTPAALTVSPDGSCGGNTTFTCEGSSYGQCCSIYGFCGGTEDYCGDNCDASSGLCGSAGLSSSSSSAVSSTSSLSSSSILPTSTHTSSSVLSTSTRSTSTVSHSSVLTSSISSSSSVSSTSIRSSSVSSSRPLSASSSLPVASSVSSSPSSSTTHSSTSSPPASLSVSTSSFSASTSSPLQATTSKPLLLSSTGLGSSSTAPSSVSTISSSASTSSALQATTSTASSASSNLSSSSSLPTTSSSVTTSSTLVASSSDAFTSSDLKSSSLSSPSASASATPSSSSLSTGVVSTESAPITTSAVSETSYTTFTSLCSENSTTVVHTHSAPLTTGLNGTSTSLVGPTATGTSSASATVSSSANSTISQPSVTGSPSSESSYSTFSTLCSENGTSIVHTHSVPLTTLSGSNGTSTVPVVGATGSGISTAPESAIPSYSANVTLSQPAATGSLSETSFSTFTTTCTESENGTTYLTTQTHAAPQPYSASPTSSPSANATTAPLGGYGGASSSVGGSTTSVSFDVGYSSDSVTSSGSLSSVATQTSVAPSTSSYVPVGAVSSSVVPQEVTVTKITSVYTTICPETSLIATSGTTFTSIFSTTSMVTSVFTSTFTLGPSSASAGYGPSAAGTSLASMSESKSTTAVNTPSVYASVSFTLPSSTPSSDAQAISTGSQSSYSQPQATAPAGYPDAASSTTVQETLTRYSTQVLTFTECPGGCEHSRGAPTTRTLTTSVPVSTYVSSALDGQTFSASWSAVKPTQPDGETLAAPSNGETSSLAASAGGKPVPTFSVPGHSLETAPAAPSTYSAGSDASAIGVAHGAPPPPYGSWAAPSTTKISDEAWPAHAPAYSTPTSGVATNSQSSSADIPTAQPSTATSAPAYASALPADDSSVASQQDDASTEAPGSTKTLFETLTVEATAQASAVATSTTPAQLPPYPMGPAGYNGTVPATASTASASAPSASSLKVTPSFMHPLEAAYTGGAEVNSFSIGSIILASIVVALAL